MKKTESIELLRSLVVAFGWRSEYLNTGKSVEQLVQEYKNYLSGTHTLDGEPIDDNH